MKQSSLLLAASVLLISACTPGTDNGNQTESSAASQQASSTVAETKNVMYRGTVEKQGVSIFMEGTHRLRLEDGRFILLHSDAVDLNAYVDMKVEVLGAVRPTVEAGGQIMRVERITSMEPSSSSSAVSSKTFCGGIAGIHCPDDQTCVDDPSDSCDPMNGGADCGGMCIPTPSSAAASSIAASAAPSSVTASVTPVSSSKAAVSSAAPVTSSITPASSTPAAATSSTAGQVSADLTAKAAIMAKDKQGAENWTQQYCSSHIGFCFPVHRNWWFKSFGATSTTFWHIEIGPTEMNNLGEGPLSVDLVSGNATSDGSVTVSGDTVTGIRSWTGGRHIVVTGPANLEWAVRYITEQIKPQS
jgi:hypothetical protein